MEIAWLGVRAAWSERLSFRIVPRIGSYARRRGKVVGNSLARDSVVGTIDSWHEKTQFPCQCKLRVKEFVTRIRHDHGISGTFPLNLIPEVV